MPLPLFLSMQRIIRGKMRPSEFITRAVEVAIASVDDIDARAETTRDV